MDIALFLRENHILSPLRFPYVRLVAVGAIGKRVAVVVGDVRVALAARVPQGFYFPFMGFVARHAVRHDVVFAYVFADVVVAIEAERVAAELP